MWAAVIPYHVVQPYLDMETNEKMVNTRQASIASTRGVMQVPEDARHFLKVYLFDSTSTRPSKFMLSNNARSLISGAEHNARIELPDSAYTMCISSKISKVRS